MNLPLDDNTSKNGQNHAEYVSESASGNQVNKYEGDEDNNGRTTKDVQIQLIDQPEDAVRGVEQVDQTRQQQCSRIADNSNDPLGLHTVSIAHIPEPMAD